MPQMSYACTGFTFCIHLKSKSSCEVVKAYVHNIYAKFGGSICILPDRGTEFKNSVVEDIIK